MVVRKLITAKKFKKALNSKVWVRGSGFVPYRRIKFRVNDENYLCWERSSDGYTGSLAIKMVEDDIKYIIAGSGSSDEQKKYLEFLTKAYKFRKIKKIIND